MGRRPHMKRFALLALLAVTLRAEPTEVVVVNINSGLIALLHNAAGFTSSQPYAEVMILHPSTLADGYRIHVTYYDAAGAKHDILRDSGSQVFTDGRPLLEIFNIDAA